MLGAVERRECGGESLRRLREGFAFQVFEADYIEFYPGRRNDVRMRTPSHLFLRTGHAPYPIGAERHAMGPLRVVQRRRTRFGFTPA